MGFGKLAEHCGECGRVDTAAGILPQEKIPVVSVVTGPASVRTHER